MIEIVPAALPLKQTFKISRNVVSISRVYYVKANGAVGEASPVRFYGELPDTVEVALDYLMENCELQGDPRDIWPVMDKALGYNYGAKAGIDLLLWDILGKAQNASVARILDIPTTAPIRTARSVGISTPAEMQAEVKANPGFSVYKLKVGFDGDVEAVAAVHEIHPGPLYVDANGGWSVEQALQRMPKMEEQGVVVFEQPVFSGHREDWLRVRECTAQTVIVDEHCRRLEDVALWAGWVDGINVKLQKSGGITPAWEMIRRAREEGLKVMIGCMLESSVGIAAAAQLAPLADYLDLDSHLLLQSDPYEGIPCEDGALLPSGEPGLGVSPTGYDEEEG